MLTIVRSVFLLGLGKVVVISKVAETRRVGIRAAVDIRPRHDTYDVLSQTQLGSASPVIWSTEGHDCVP